MIHRPSRDALALALRRYAAKHITNDDLHDVRVDWRDRGAVAVKEMAWGLYDDTSVHRADGKRALNREARREIAKWIVFLHSDFEYLWPQYSFVQIVNWPMNLLTLGWWERRKERRRAEFRAAGEYMAWPFVRVSDLKGALASPRYFRGAEARAKEPLPPASIT